MFSFRMQKDPFVLFKEAYCKKKTVQVKAEQHFLFFGGGGQFLKNTPEHLYTHFINSFTSKFI